MSGQPWAKTWFSWLLESCSFPCTALPPAWLSGWLWKSLDFSDFEIFQLQNEQPQSCAEHKWEGYSTVLCGTPGNLVLPSDHSHHTSAFPQCVPGLITTCQETEEGAQPLSGWKQHFLQVTHSVSITCFLRHGHSSHVRKFSLSQPEVSSLMCRAVVYKHDK